TAAVESSDGTWRVVYQSPEFGDIASPRLPRDPDYSCPEGPSWVCIPPVDGAGSWSTERIWGGGARIGDTALILPSLGYGERKYSNQSSTFGDSSLDQVSLYLFSIDPATGDYSFKGFYPWPHS